ncbi:Hypothetical protein R9X50_00072300 [Acrodontium crateriforme]|uniref:ubiquitinyl hydrolase 1 n=1 Tax=Acrodontium crateriforme TaxID=150365 RepID=A0AAQ3M149_9PEZI|nr:Hypothetical protein R9X50_00072300 [Acrodontium crateriforme]
MSGVHRFLSRREKRPSSTKNHQHHPANATTNKPDHFGGVFTLTESRSSDEKNKVTGVLERLRHYGIDTMVPANVEYALHAPGIGGDGDAAFKLLMLLQDTYEGIVRQYSPETRFLGAENREAVTCYLDALLFAMFARLDSFEAMLYDNFEDIPRKRLAGLLRLWVNMLRTGRLITTDITKHLQDALAECGWTDAAKLRQQDPSEAFTFITGQLELPLLTLKMDLYHTGREDPQDDHKFVNERLLEVAILDEPQDGSSVITLEHCLEHYFNNRIEVKRHLDQRRNTLKLDQMTDGQREKEVEAGFHIEVADTEPQLNTRNAHFRSPTVESPTKTDFAETASASKNPVENLRPVSRKRADSIFSQRKMELVGVDPKMAANEQNANTDSNGRKLSTRTEVLMPAWQFFKLLPWYTDHMPVSDAQVAAHFSKKRPVLGICLKRYSYTNSGQARRLDTYVDIPLEIAVPNFVSDDNMQDDGPLVGNFRLLLQSVVCHRGVSVNSGHYICLTRGTAANARAHNRESIVSDTSNESESTDLEDPWMRFDDLAKERISYVDIHQALKQETPYLLFYQVQPIGDDGHSIHDLPSYAEATSGSQNGSEAFIQPEKLYLNTSGSSQNNLAVSTSNVLSASDTADFANTGSTRTSLDASHIRGRSSLSIADSEQRRRQNGALSNEGYTQSQTSYSVPSTPVEEKPNSFLAVANKISSNARRGSRQSKAGSRASSAGPAGILDSAGNSDKVGSRFSLKDLNMTKLLSRGDANQAVVPDVAFIEGNSSNEKLTTGGAVSARNSGEDYIRNDNPTNNAKNPIPPLLSEGIPRVAPGTAGNVPRTVSGHGTGAEIASPPYVEVGHSTAPDQTAPKSRGKDKAAIREGKKRAKGDKHEERDCAIM